MDNSSKGRSSAGGGDDERLWMVLGAGMLAVAAWTQRGRLWEALAPYGLTTGAKTSFQTSGNPYDPDPSFGGSQIRYSGDLHLTAGGWVGVLILAAAALGVLACVGSGLAWSRWQRGGGVTAVPPIPVWGAAAVAAGIVLVVVVWLTGWPFAAAFVAACAAAAVGMLGGSWARTYRLTQVWRGLAEQVLGHGHPGLSTVRATGWQHQGAGAAWPGRIEASTGPGWQHKPAELAELNRHAAVLGWPAYSWTRDPMRRTVVGVAETKAAR